MGMRSRDFIGKAEGIKNREIGLKIEIERLECDLISMRSQRNILEMEIQCIQAEISAAYCDTDEEGNVDYYRIAALQSKLSNAASQLSSLDNRISSAQSELLSKQSQLELVKEEKASTLFEIQQRAQKTAQNISYASGMCGSYANIGAKLSSSLTGSFNALSTAASILGGSVGGIGGLAGGVAMARSSSKGSPSGGVSVHSNPISAAFSKNSSSSLTSSKYSSSGKSSQSFAAKKNIVSSGMNNSGRSSVLTSKQTSNTNAVSAFQIKNGAAVKNTASFQETLKTSQCNGSNFQKSVSCTANSVSSAKYTTNQSSMQQNSFLSKSDISMSAMEKLSAYMNKNNYGMDDYDTYSKDPEWVALHSAVFHGQKNSSHSHQEAYSHYQEWQNKGGMELSCKRKSFCTNVSAKDIFGVRGAEDSGFWTYKQHSQQDYINMARQVPIVRAYMQSGKSVSDIIAMGGIVGACAANYFQSPVKVGRYKDAYIHLDDGRHRIEAAKIAGVDIPVDIIEDYGCGYDRNAALNAISSNNMDFFKNTLPYTSPLAVPRTADIRSEYKENGYYQVRYNWKHGEYKYESRWHTHTSNAPEYSRDTWVVTRTLPGIGHGKNPRNKKVEYFVKDMGWVPENVWRNACNLRHANMETAESRRILDNGHWDADQ